MIRLIGRFVRENAVALLVLWMFNQELLHLLLNAVIGQLPAKLLVWGVYVMLYAAAWNSTPGLLTRRDAVMYSGWGLLLLLSVVFLEKEQSTYLMIVLKAGVKCGLAYFIGKMLALEKSRNFMRIMALAVVMMALTYIILFRLSSSALNAEIMYGESGRRAGQAAEYSMFLGYALLPCACVAVCLVVEGWLWQVPFMLLMIYAVVSSGTRGPLVCTFGAGLAAVASTVNLKSWKSWLLLLTISVCAVLVIVNLAEILGWFLERFTNLHLSTRIIKTLLNESFTNSSGRNKLAEAAIRGINEYMFTGTGIFRDRQYLMTHSNIWGGTPINASTGTYSHSIFLDFPLQFGVFAGGAMLVYLLHTIYKSWRLSVSKYTNRVEETALLKYIILLSIGLFPHMFSGSWIDDGNFYMMMGFILEELRRSSELKQTDTSTASLNIPLKINKLTA